MNINKSKSIKFTIFLSICLLLVTFLCNRAGIIFAQDEPDQQLTDFNFMGYNKEGEKSWQVDGKSADIFKDNVLIDNFVGKIYGEEDITLKADKGSYDRGLGKMHLQDNVVATTASGAKLTTDSLYWDQKSELITTQDLVNIERQNLKAQGQGAKADPGLNKVYLEKEVRVEVLPQENSTGQNLNKKDKIVITCDGPLEVNYEKNEAIFNNNVKANSIQGDIFCDKMSVYFSIKESTSKDEEQASAGMFGSKSGKIEKIIAEGSVKIVQGENVTFSEKAVYTSADKKIILTGRPKLFLYTEGEGSDAPFGN